MCTALTWSQLLRRATRTSALLYHGPPETAPRGACVLSPCTSVGIFDGIHGFISDVQLSLVEKCQDGEVETAQTPDKGGREADGVQCESMQSSASQEAVRVYWRGDLDAG